jgi:endonuclease/exonuclease/phosphatase (EEP) superfamily protein YafD
VIVLEVVTWTAVAVMVAVLATQLVGWSGAKVVVSLQAATPYLFVLSLPIGVVAAVTGRWLLAGASGAIAVALVAMCWQVRRSAARHPAAGGKRMLRVFHGNLLYYNGRTAELGRVVAELDADVLAFTEYTPTHSGGLYVSPLGAAFPHRLEHPDASAGGSAIWSRYPLTQLAAPPALYRSTAAVVGARTNVALYVVHPPNPLDNLDEWRAELDGLAALRGAVSHPAILIGDFNATFWHPPFRRLLAAGWRDVHLVAGRGFSSSWPNDRAWLPPFLRLDHALVDDLLVVTEVVDADLPGSDHRGFVVGVGVNPTGSAAPAGRSRRLQAATGGSSTASSPRRGLPGRTTSP